MSSDRAPDVAGKIRAYRTWRLTSTGALASTGMTGHEWSSARLHAECNAAGTRGVMLRKVRKDEWELETAEPTHTPPGENCRCGVYATKTISRAIERSGACPRHYVVGAVDLWGSVIHHEDGYRAEHAEIVELYDPRAYHIQQAAFELLHARYGVPISLSPPELGALKWEATCFDCMANGWSDAWRRSMHFITTASSNITAFQQKIQVGTLDAVTISVRRPGAPVDRRKAALDAKRDAAQMRVEWLNRNAFRPRDRFTITDSTC